MSLPRAIKNLTTMASIWVRGVKKDQRPPDISWYEYAKAKNEWLIQHTDPVFGKPVDADGLRYFENARGNWNLSVVPNEYDPVFRFSPTGKVRVRTDEFPLLDQKFIFEWMVEKMDDVSKAVTELLLHSPRSWGVTEQEAATAFRPDRITRIDFEGSGPVVWKIIFDTDIGEGEALVGIAQGKDQHVEGASLDFG